MLQCAWVHTSPCCISFAALAVLCADSAESSWWTLCLLLLHPARPKEYFGTPQCFELFGMDVMFDEDLRCWLLEFNALPGLDTLDDEQREVLLDDVISLAVDPLLPPTNPPPAFDDASSEGPAHLKGLYRLWAGGGAQTEQPPGNESAVDCPHRLSHFAFYSIPDWRAAHRTPVRQAPLPDQG